MRKEAHLIALWGLVLRAVVLAVVLAALIAGPRAGWGWAVGLIGAGLAVYAVARRPGRGDFTYAAASAIVIPDLLGFALVGLFAAFPVWATPDLGSGALHPSVWLMWPMALLSTSLPFIAWRSESFALRLTSEALEMTRGVACWHVPYAEISGVGPWRRDLPRWMRAVVPFLLATGRYGPAGAVMLARERRGIALRVRGHPDLIIETDSLHPAGSKLLKALSQRGIPGLPHSPARNGACAPAS